MSTASLFPALTAPMNTAGSVGNGQAVQEEGWLFGGRVQRGGR